MTEDSDPGKGRRDYRWTPSRIALATAIVGVGGLYIGTVAFREIGNIQEGLARDAAYAKLLKTTTEEHAADFNLDNLTIPRRELSFGGPPKDGIPALSQPEVVDIAVADHLYEDDRLIGVSIGGETRAYPIRALMYHEAVNDEIGGTPIAVVYCPLCDSVSVVDRRLGGTVHEFGISGMLVNSNVLFYDRTDDSLWSQVGLTAISGPNAGSSLVHLPWEITTALQWREAHPDSTVMTFNTGYNRPYNENPYTSYFDYDDQLRFPISREDDRLRIRAPVVGVKLGDALRAYPIAAVRAAPGGLVRDSLAGERVVIAADPDGESVRVLEVPHGAMVVHTFWFAWAAFHPETEIYE